VTTVHYSVGVSRWKDSEEKGIKEWKSDRRKERREATIGRRNLSSILMIDLRW